MKVLVVYDSTYGNTERIAQAIGNAMAGEVRVARADEVDPAGLAMIDMLVVGSPTQGGRATQPVQDFLDRIPLAVVKGIKVASFDTRYEGRFVKIFGFAAERIAGKLESKGGKLVSRPAAFLVTGKRGPLKDGELERAAAWAREIAK